MSTPTQHFPLKIKRGSVTVKIYRSKQADTKTGFVYTVTWSSGGRRSILRRADLGEARLEAVTKAEQMAAGKVDVAKQMTAEDAGTLTEARKICGDTPLLSALREWQKVNTLTKGHGIPAAELWAQRNNTAFKRIKISEAIDKFIAQKVRAGKQGEATYRAKLKPLIAFFPNSFIDAITAHDLAAYLEQFQDGVTRNDLRKRAIALWRWAQKSKFIPRGMQLEIENTERAQEERTEIGTLTPATYLKLLEFFLANHPKQLAAVVLAGFGAIRQDEIHGKRQDRSKRQIWEDIDLGRKFLNVTVAKKNTPAWRLVTLCDAAIDWLKLCPDRKGPVCDAGAMENVRALAIAAGFHLPENCFRHSAISYRIAMTGDKAETATWAGNSVGEIDRRYRRPMPKEDGEAWFAIQPPARDDSGAGKEVAP